MNQKLPSAIKQAIESGEAILFLGSGASFDALLGGVKKRIYANTLRDLLSDKFLDGAHKENNLMTVADYCRAESSLLKVQKFINETFRDLYPANFHEIIPTFRWRAIVTTNYDLVVERAYENCKSPLQKLVPVSKDGELQDALEQQNTVPYIKIHGSIQNYADVSVPLVLDSNEYSKFKTGRQSIVKAFAEWATQSPIIFCGYSLSDENIKEILFDIGDASQLRDAYLYVDVAFSDIQTRYWQSRRIFPFAATFESFLKDIDSTIPLSNRILSTAFKNTSSISKWIPSHVSPTPELQDYLNTELLHILPEVPPSTALDPKKFYSGLDNSFLPIYADLDVKRDLMPKVLNDAVIDTLESTKPKLFFLKGYAGCGKSVLIRRIALETSKLLDKPLVLWIGEGTVIRDSLIFELQRLVDSRIYLFIDDGIEHHESLARFVEQVFRLDLPITIMACARTNELNIYGKDLFGKITRDFELADLEDKEVLDLLKKLSFYKVLGPLEQYSDSERKLFIDKFYGQQLLVALHEITFGDSFEDIIVSEFEKIQPREAQQLYLDICTLHQSGVSVRAGLLSRVSGKKIAELNEYLEGPLARVMRTYYDSYFRDFVYKSRHSEISKMVFALAIRAPEARAEQLIRIISKIDLEYSSDKKAFFELVKGRYLADLFEKKELALSVFEAAERSGAPQSFLLHQRAILELNHRTGNIEIAADYLKRAEIANKNSGYRDGAIQHTKANLLRKKGQVATSLIERERHRSDARAILTTQLNRKDNSYPQHLLGQILLDELKDNFRLFDGNDQQGLHEAAIMRVTSELTRLIDDTIKKDPADAQMTLLRSDFLKVMGKQPKAIEVLERFHKSTPENSAITRVLGEALYAANKIDEGITVLREAVLASPSDKLASLSLAKMLIKKDEDANSETILSFLRRSFSDGDSHYDARLLYARCNLLYGDLKRGKDEFFLLKKAFIENKERRQYPVCEHDGKEKTYSGKISMKQSGHGYISSSELRFNAHLGKKGLNSTEWHSLSVGDTVQFTISFNFHGPVATLLQNRSSEIEENASELSSV